MISYKKFFRAYAQMSLAACGPPAAHSLWLRATQLQVGRIGRWRRRNLPLRVEHLRRRLRRALHCGLHPVPRLGRRRRRQRRKHVTDELQGRATRFASAHCPAPSLQGEPPAPSMASAAAPPAPTEKPALAVSHPGAIARRSTRHMRRRRLCCLRAAALPGATACATPRLLVRVPRGMPSTSPRSRLTYVVMAASARTREGQSHPQEQPYMCMYRSRAPNVSL